MWSIRKGSWKQQTKKNNDLKGKWNYFFHISIVFSAGFCCQCSMLTVHLWWILQDVSALFLYRACCTKISCFILWLTRKQSIFSILEFPCCKDSVSNMAAADSRATVQRKKQPQETQFKVLVVGETLISGGTDCNTTPALSTEWQPVCSLLVHLVAVVPPYLERATGGNNASSCVGCVLADVLPPSVWVILCFYGNQSIFGWFSFSRASPQCNQC